MDVKNSNYNPVSGRGRKNTLHYLMIRNHRKKIQNNV